MTKIQLIEALQSLDCPDDTLVLTSNPSYVEIDPPELATFYRKGKYFYERDLTNGIKAILIF